MKPPVFGYHRPGSVAEAVDALAEPGAKVLAGGQSLVPMLSMRLAAPSTLVDINHLDAGRDVEVAEDSVRIGCLVRHRQLERHQAAWAANPLLRRTLQHVSHATIRNRGTTVGSLVHADPAAEMPAVLRLLGGCVDVVSAERGERRIDADELYTGPLETSLRPDEMALAATFRTPPPGSGTSWVELARRAGDYALVGVGAVVTAGDGGSPHARVALVSMGATPVVVDVTPAVAEAGPWAPDTEAVGDLLADHTEPEDDVHASADYRAHLARVLTVRALRAAAADCGTTEG